jgi:hypothetical protein
MTRIFEIAREITNPYSLAALSFLVLFFLFRSVIAKTGVQTGRSGYKIISYLMTLVALLAGLTLLLVFGFKTYEVYQKSAAVSDMVVQKFKTPDLRVDYEVSQFTGADIAIGNTGQGIILVSELTYHWDYRKCPEFDEPVGGAPLLTYQYDLQLTTAKGSKVLDSRTFKYGPGEVEGFRINLRYPDYGVYTTWLSFRYRRLGEVIERILETPKGEHRVCRRALDSHVSPLD